MYILELYLVWIKFFKDKINKDSKLISMFNNILKTLFFNIRIN